ncbi:hypothetical protein ACAW74_28445 [Fibrella sp. WM1]|uniref:nSTAND3 domain-containing NTPase n=1 Tax=Fibrella musci TaxID=3242485 RepID=UPI0035224342
MGTNFLEIGFNKNEDNEIVRFIKLISSSNDKILILTTREYILSQAKDKSEILNYSDIDFSKCIIDLGSYTNLIKAEILYSHLYYSKVPEKYINAIVNTGFYNFIIYHNNYNPRIIEYFTSKSVWRGIDTNDFLEKIKDFLNNPTKVWEHAFLNKISVISQYLLINLLPFYKGILIDDLKEVLYSFFSVTSSKYNNLCFDSIHFMKSISELEGSFITTSSDNRGRTIVKFKNPSIFDFLVIYVDTHLKDVIDDMMKSSIFLNQLIDISVLNSNKINLVEVGDMSFIAKLFNKIVLDFNKMSILDINIMVFQSRIIISNKHYNSIDDKLVFLIEKFNVSANCDMYNFIVKKFQEVAEFGSIDGRDISRYVSLLNLVKSKVHFNVLETVSRIVDNIKTIEDIEALLVFSTLYVDEFSVYLKTDNNLEFMIQDVISSRVENSDSMFLSDLIDIADRFRSAFDLNLGYTIDRIHSRLEEEMYSNMRDAHDSNEDYIDEDDRHEMPYRNEETLGRSINLIEDIFDSLKIHSGTKDD